MAKTNLKEQIDNEIERTSYKKPNPALSGVAHEIESKINALDYYSNLSESEKLAFKEQLAKKKATTSYITYLKYVYGNNYIITPFHKVIASICQSAVERMEKGENVRILLSVPPQYGKSLTITEALPSWFIGKHPNLSCILTAYNADIAEKFGDRNRQKVKQFGKEIFGAEISDSQDNKTLFQIKGNQGQVFSAGILGGLTSNPSALTIVDDPFKNGVEASNIDIRNKVYETFMDSVMTRSRPNGSIIIVVHTRWHEDDLIGRLLKQSGWIYVNIPCVWEKGYDKLLHRKVGEVLCPELGHSVEWANSIRQMLV